MANVIEVNHGPFDEKSYMSREAQERDFEFKVRGSFEKSDLATLRKMFPEPIDLLKYRTSAKSPFCAGGSVLHVAADTASFEFLQTFLNDYFPPDSSQETTTIKNKLLNVRDMEGKLATEVTREKIINSAENGNIVDEKQRYHFLKQEILASWPEVTPDDIHYLPNPQDTEYNQEGERGLPVSTAFIVGSDGKPGLMWQKEVYPTIRLRNIPKNSGDAGTYVEIKNIPLDTPNFLDAAIKQMDFPEDYADFFNKLGQVVADYKTIRENPDTLASYRFFTANGGVLVIESGIDPTVVGNSKSCGNYGGYSSMNDHGTPFIVLPLLGMYDKSFLMHELYHHVDFVVGVGTQFSNTDISKAVLMTAQEDPSTFNKWIFNNTDSSYSAEWYMPEAMARVMQYPGKDYVKDPLLLKLHQIANKLSIAKVDNTPAVGNRISNALTNIPENQEMMTCFADFMKIKRLKGIDKAEFEKKKQEFDATFLSNLPKYKKVLQNTMDDLLINIKNLEKAPKEAQQIILSPYLLAQPSSKPTVEEDALFLKEYITDKCVAPYSEDKSKANASLVDMMVAEKDPLAFAAIKTVYNELNRLGIKNWQETEETVVADKDTVRSFKEQQALFKEKYPDKDMPASVCKMTAGAYGCFDYNRTFSKYAKRPDDVNKPSFETAIVITNNFENLHALEKFDRQQARDKTYYTYCDEVTEESSKIEIVEALGKIQSGYKFLYGEDVQLPKEITLSALNLRDFIPTEDGDKPIVKRINNYREKLDDKYENQKELAKKINKLRGVTQNTNVANHTTQEQKRVTTASTAVDPLAVVGVNKLGRR